MIAALALALAPSLPADDALDARVAAYLRSVEADGRMNGVALVEDGGREVLRQAYGAFDAEAGTPNALDTRFRIGSVTKLFTGVALLRLVDRGAVDLDAPVATYRPAFALGERVTLRQLLNFTSGLPQELGGSADVTQVRFDEEGRAGPFLDAEVTELEHEPGTRRAYSNVGYWVAGAVIEAVTGKRWEDAVTELVLEPLGMEDTGFGRDEVGTDRHAFGHERDADGRLARVAPYPVSGRYASGSMHSTLADLRRFCLAFAEDGFLSPASRDEAFRRFRTDRRELTPGGGPVLTGSGFVPGWRAYLRYQPQEGRLVILLNNVSVLPPQAIAEIGLDCIRLLRGDEPRGVSGGGTALEMQSAEDGLPDTALGRAAEGFLAAVRAGDAEAFAAWHARHMPDLAREDVLRSGERLFELPERLGGFEAALYREEGERALLVGVRGTAPVDALFTFRASSLDPLVIEAVDVGQARR